MAALSSVQGSAVFLFISSSLLYEWGRGLIPVGLAIPAPVLPPELLALLPVELLAAIAERDFALAVLVVGLGGVGLLLPFVAATGLPFALFKFGVGREFHLGADLTVARLLHLEPEHLLPQHGELIDELVDYGEVGGYDQVLLVVHLGRVGPVVAAGEGYSAVNYSELVVHVVSAVVNLDVYAAPRQLFYL